MDGEVTPALHSIQRYMIVGIAIVGFVTFGIGGWAATSELTIGLHRGVPTRRSCSRKN